MRRQQPSKEILVSAIYAWAQDTIGFSRVTKTMIRSIPADVLRRGYYKGYYFAKGWKHIGNQRAFVRQLFGENGYYQCQQAAKEQRNNPTPVQSELKL